MTKRPTISFRKKSESNGVLSFQNINLNESLFIDVRNLYRQSEIDFLLRTSLAFTKVSDYIYEITADKKGFYSAHLEVQSKKDRSNTLGKEINLRSNTLIIIVQGRAVLFSSSELKSSSNIKSSS